MWFCHKNMFSKVYYNFFQQVSNQSNDCFSPKRLYVEFSFVANIVLCFFQVTVYNYPPLNQRNQRKLFYLVFWFNGSFFFFFAFLCERELFQVPNKLNWEAPVICHSEDITGKCLRFLLISLSSLWVIILNVINLGFISWIMLLIFFVLQISSFCPFNLHDSEFGNHR